MSCFYDYQKLLGESSHSMRYGLESNVFFLSGGIFQTYDFTNNKIDFLGSLGVKFGKWFNDYLGFEINAGIAASRIISFLVAKTLLNCLTSTHMYVISPMIP